MPSIEPLNQASSFEAATGGASSVILFLTVFIDLLGFGIVVPFLPLFAKRMGVGAVGIGVVLAIYSLMQLIAAPILGRVSDRMGRRPVIMLGLLGSSIGYVIYGFAGSLLSLLVSRAVHGASAGTVSTAQAYIADTTSGMNRARGMGLIGAAFGLGFVLGPALGGLLGHASLRTPVFFAAALTFADFIFAALRLPESHPPEPGARLDLGRVVRPLAALPRELGDHRLLRMFIVAFLMTFAFAALEATFAMMAPQVYGYGAAGVGGLLAFAGLMQALAQGYLVGKVVPHVGEARLLKIGLVMLTAGLAPIGSVSSHSALLLALGILSLGYGFASPSIASLISRSVEEHRQGQVLGVNQSALSLARILGPIAGGVTYEVAGPAAPYLAGAVAVVLAISVTGALGDAPT